MLPYNTDTSLGLQLAVQKHSFMYFKLIYTFMFSGLKEWVLITTLN